MTKADIFERVHGKVGGFSKKEAADLVESVFMLMKKTLSEGENLKISSFGTFVVRGKKARMGRNPQTGQPLMITDRRVLTFKPSHVLKDLLNHHVQQTE